MVHLNFQVNLGFWESACLPKRAKKFVSDSRGLVNFAIGLVILVLDLPNGQVLFFGEIQITEGF